MGRIIQVGGTWPSHDAGERHFFQLGAPGGATKDEYVSGGERVERYLAAHCSKERRFLFPPCDGERVEAEWGFEPELREDIERLAMRRGWLPAPLRLEDVKRFLATRSYPGVAWIEPGAEDRLKAA